jgi:glyoxylase-like metal-dependent hydrolase (beta-lactamase superfamily II)
MSEWEWAVDSAEQRADDYRLDDYLPLRDAGQLRLVKGTEQIVPGVTVEWTGGHCPGHQVVWIEDNEEKLLVPADIIPTPAMLRLNIVMSYDLIHSRLLTTKRDLIDRALDSDATVIFQHAVKNPFGTLERDDNGVVSIKKQK